MSFWVEIYRNLFYKTNFYVKAHLFFSIQKFIKKIVSEKYSLSHILLCFQGSYSKFPPKSHMFLVFKNSSKKLHQGQYGLTHIVLSRILCKCLPITHIFFGVKNVLKIISGTVLFDCYFPFQGFYQVFFKGSCFFCFKSLQQILIMDNMV